MESKAGSILLLISSILVFLVSLIPLIFLVMLLISPESVKSSEGLSPTVNIIIMLIVFVLLLIFGFLQLHASRLMKDPMTTKKGGVIGLITGILTFNLIAIIGGILGIINGSKQS